MKTFQNVTLRFCALIAALALFAQSVQAEPVLRGYWTFDNDTVDNGVITESSGYYLANYGEDGGSHNGKLVGDGISFKPITGEPGNHLSTGNYISFTSDSYAVIQNTSTNSDLESPNYHNTFDPAGADFTISAWVKGSPDGNWEPFIAKNGEGGYGWQLRRRETGNTPTFTYRISGGDDDPTVNMATGTSVALNDDQWHNLIAVYGGTYRELYMDGQLVTRIVDTAASAGGQGEPLVFSGRYTSGAYTGFANISLDNVAFYSGALKNNQITYLSNGGNPTQIGSVEVGTKTINIGLNSAAGSDGTTLTRNGNISRKWLDDDITFDGNGSYIRTNLPVRSAGMNGSFTASAWVYLDKSDDLKGDRSIFGNNATGNNNGLHLIVRDAHPHMGFYGNDLQASETLETGKWYYLTWQYDADAQSQTLYLNGEQIKTETGHAAFAGTNNLDLGTSMGGGYLNGKLKGISITDAVLTADEIQSQMNSLDSKRIENFQWGKDKSEWYSGGGASLGNLYSYPTFNVLSMYHAPSDNSEKTVVDQGGTDKTTGMLWGPQFKVNQDAPNSTVFTFDAVGGNAALDVTSRSSGGVGIALWDLTVGDYVRDENNNVLYGNGNSNDNLKAGSISLKGLQGHNLMVVDVDRSTGGWGWVGLTNLTVDGSQVSVIADAAQHHIILNDFNFDTANDFHGMYEVDANGNRLDSITHFTNGSRNGSAATNFYVDSSGTFDKGKKGFLSSGTAEYGEEQTTGVLRSDPFLIQGDILEYYIAGGNNINNKHLDLIDADTGDVYFSATGENTNDFRYDFWNLKDIQGKSVYLQVVDADGGTSWSHLELDQIRQVKFAPSAVEVQAAGNSFDSRELKFYEVEPGFNVNSYNLEGTNVDSIISLADYITGGADATEKKILVTLDNFKVTDEGEPVGVDVFSVLNVKSSGLYTLVIGNDEPFVLKINGKQVIASEGSDEESIFIPLQFSEVGQYALEMLYLDTTGTGVSIYAAEGALDEWKRAATFELLSGTGEHNLLAYARDPDPNKIPEPSTWALLILGAAGMLYWRKRK